MWIVREWQTHTFTRQSSASHRPIVIVDEAQNVRSALSFETLARFNPSCILEFTATPHRETIPATALQYFRRVNSKPSP